jgi:hypothetical protein
MENDGGPPEEGSFTHLPIKYNLRIRITNSDGSIRKRAFLISFKIFGKSE